MDADDLLMGPRGRRLCWELLGLASFGLDDVPRQIVSEAVIRAVDSLRRTDKEAGRLILKGLQRSTDSAMYWQPPDEADHALASPKLIDQLRPVAEVLAGHEAVAWWQSTLADEQQYIRFLDLDEETEPPVLLGARAALVAWKEDEQRQDVIFRKIRTGNHPDIPAERWDTCGGMWWSAPITYPLVSTTCTLAAVGPVGLWLVEDSPMSPKAACWPVAPVRPPRVYEVTGAQAWADLVARHPFDVTDSKGPDWYNAFGRRGKWLIPDWPAVAEEFDAAHVSVAGYLTTAGTPVDIADEAASALAGWAPDETYWLTDILDLCGTAEYWLANGQEPDWFPGDR